MERVSGDIDTRWDVKLESHDVGNMAGIISASQPSSAVLTTRLEGGK
jgi:hypothetical protein